MNKLIIRTDARTQIGTGHIMRCLALAQSWRDSGGEVTLITTCQVEELAYWMNSHLEVGYESKDEMVESEKKIIGFDKRLWFLSMWHDADNVRASEGNHHYKQGGNHGNFYAYKPNEGGI